MLDSVFCILYYSSMVKCTSISIRFLQLDFITEIILYLVPDQARPGTYRTIQSQENEHNHNHLHDNSSYVNLNRKKSIDVLNIDVEFIMNKKETIEVVKVNNNDNNINKKKKSKGIKKIVRPRSKSSNREPNIRMKRDSVHKNNKSIIIHSNDSFQSNVSTKYIKRRRHYLRFRKTHNSSYQDLYENLPKKNKVVKLNPNKTKTTNMIIESPTTNNDKAKPVVNNESIKDYQNDILIKEVDDDDLNPIKTFNLNNQMKSNIYRNMTNKSLEQVKKSGLARSFRIFITESNDSYEFVEHLPSSINLKNKLSVQSRQRFYIEHIKPNSSKILLQVKK